MIQELEQMLHMHKWTGKKIILAISGGADSMVMAALFRMANQNIVIAHFNYALRAEESEGDQQLVRVWAEKYEIPFYTKKFELGKLLEKEGGNLQELARNLRYQWFEELRLSLGFDFIATAHHQQDSVETLLINFFKGTGIAGLHGILPENGKIIRPMLGFKKEEILRFAKKKQIPWRMDSSNKKNDYARNKIRNQVLPLISEIFPTVQENLKNNMERFHETEILYNESIERYKKLLLEQRVKDWYIPVLKLKQCKPLFSILYELLKPFGFKSAQIPDIIKLVDAETGKIVQNNDFKIIKNRGFLIITANEIQESSFVMIEQSQQMQQIETELFILKTRILPFQESKDEKEIEAATRNEVYVDLNELEFPLYLRPWKQGDYFYPLGMNKKKKKISRFLIDNKIPLHEKEKVWVLESKSRVVWVLGFRLDERFKVTPNTKRILHLKLALKSHSPCYTKRC